MEPTLLALDTSTDLMVLALSAPGGVWRHVAPGGAAASAQLLPRVLSLLAEAGINKRALDAVAFGGGPGAFTGLRTACAVAQGLAYGLGRPVLPIDSLLLVADDAQHQTPATDPTALHWVAMDARMDEAYAAAYRLDGGRWQVHHAPALYTLPALAQRWSQAPPVRVAGSAIVAFADRLPCGTAWCCAVEQDRPAALARLARQAWADGVAIDPALVLPLYLRDKVALTTAERALQRSASPAP